MRALWKRIVPAGVALLLCLATGVLTARPSASEDELTDLARRFSFEAVPVNSEPANASYRRPVQPALEHFHSWISAVGAAVALTDLRGLGRPADACIVDPRDDSVTVLPVPTAGGPIYPHFKLTPVGLAYDLTMAPMGCVPADLDEDGAMDFLVYYWGRSPVLFINSQPSGGNGPAADDFRAVELISPMEVWNTTAMNVGDIDGDGHLDIAVGNYFPDGAKVLDPTAVADGRMMMQDSMGKARNAGVNRLLLTRPTGQAGTKPELVDASTALPNDSARSWTLALGFQDLTGNGLPDLYVANDFGPDQLLINTSLPGNVELAEVTGRRNLTTPRSEVLGYDSFKGMGVTFTYPSGEGLPMIAVSNITTPFALHESNFAFVPTGDAEELLDGRLPYDERSEELGMSRSGWCWDIKAGDFDNSGSDELMQATGFVKGDRNRWPQLQELAMGNDALLRHPQVWPKFEAGDDLSGHERNPLWVRTADGRYADLANRVGIDFPYVSRGLAFGDVDGDGRLDVVMANQWEDSVLLRNTGPGLRPAVDLRLVQPGAAGGVRDAIGAQVELRGAGWTQKAQLFPANGHAGVSASEIHLALPEGDSAQATISWRAGTTVHHATVEVRPGHHTVLLSPDGTVVIQ